MRLFLIVFFVLHWQSTKGQIFNKIYNPNGNSRANSVAVNSSGFIFAGGTTFGGFELGAIFVNDIGDTIWRYNYDLGSGGGDFIQSVISINNQFVFGGFSRDLNETHSESFLIKLNDYSDTIWVKKYGLSNRSERCYNVKQTNDGGFIFCGLRFNIDSSGNSTDSDVYLVKTDSLGNQEWEKTFGGADYDYSSELEILPDGGYFIFGSTYSYGVGLYSMYLIKTDSLGNFKWQKTYGGSLTDYGISITKSIDGNFLLAGSTETSLDNYEAYLLKIDTAGNILWDKKFDRGNDYDEFVSVNELPDSKIIVAGNTINYGGSRNLPVGWLMKLNQNGDSLWSKTYNYFATDSSDHYFYDMTTTYDGGFAMCGMTIDLRQGANPTNSMWLVKTDSLGCDISNCVINVSSEINEEEQLIFNVYPNPSNGKITISYYIPQFYANCSIMIFNSLGQKIKDFPIVSTIKAEIDLSENLLENGLYFCYLASDDKLLDVKKIVIIK